MGRIAVIGLGNMGAPMAANLVKAGHSVTGYDAAAAVSAAAVSRGVVAATSAGEAASGADVVLTMLPNGAILSQVVADVLPAMTPGALLLDCSTVDVAAARAMHAAADAAGVLSIDAPVSGGVGGAEAGTLTFMAGGADAAFAAAKPLFDVMGKTAVHCGGPGAGQAAKICNNMILGVSMIGVCEAFALADALGLDRQKMFDVASTSSGQCWSLNTYCPAPGVGPESPSDRGYQPGFAVGLMLKDLRLSQEAAAAEGVETTIGAKAAEIYTALDAAGGGAKDFSAVLPWLASGKKEV